MVGAELPAEYLIEPASIGRGFREVAPQTAPAAGADFSLVLEGRYITRLLSVYVTLTPDANAANREVVLQYLDGNGNLYDVMGAGVTVPASTTTPYTFSAFQGVAEWTVDSGVIVPLHPVFLSVGHTVKLHVKNIQAGDTLTTIRFHWERFWTDEAH